MFGAALKSDSGLGHARNRVTSYVDQSDILAVVGLVIVSLHRDTFGTKGMVFGAQQFGNGGVVHPLANFRAHEFGVVLVSRLVGHDVVEAAEPFGKPRLCPDLFVKRVALFLRHIKSPARIKVLHEAGKGLAAALENLLITGFDIGLLLVGDAGITQRAAVIR